MAARNRSGTTSSPPSGPRARDDSGLHQHVTARAFLARAALRGRLAGNLQPLAVAGQPVLLGAQPVDELSALIAFATSSDSRLRRASVKAEAALSALAARAAAVVRARSRSRLSRSSSSASRACRRSRRSIRPRASSAAASALRGLAIQRGLDGGGRRTPRPRRGVPPRRRPGRLPPRRGRPAQPRPARRRAASSCCWSAVRSAASAASRSRCRLDLGQEAAFGLVGAGQALLGSGQLAPDPSHLLAGRGQSRLDLGDGRLGLSRRPISLAGQRFQL